MWKAGQMVHHLSTMCHPMEMPDKLAQECQIGQMDQSGKQSSQEQADQLEQPDRPVHMGLQKCFSCGPTAKRPSWQLPSVEHLVGRSHRSDLASELIQQCVSLMRSLLEIPPSYSVCLISGSATAAVESAIYSLVNGAVNVIVSGVFSQRWCGDVSALSQQVSQFSREEMLEMSALPDGDVVFCVCETMNATMIGVQEVASRKSENSLLICDATSVVFGMHVDFASIDAVAFSLQKMLGGEPGIGVLILSPKAIQRAYKVDATRHIPHMLNVAGMTRTTRKYAQNARVRDQDAYMVEASEQIEENAQVGGWHISNTISLMLMQEFLDNMLYLQEIGGITQAQKIISENYQTLKECVKESHILELQDSTTPIQHIGYVKYRKEALHSTNVSPESEYHQAYRIAAKWLAENELAYDVFSSALPCFRFWMGPWINAADVKNLVILLEKAFHAVLK